jgi:hypothetical protein
MTMVFARGLFVPLCGAAVFAMALSTPQRLMPFLAGLLGIGLLTAAVVAIARAWRASHPQRNVRRTTYSQAPVIAVAVGAYVRTLDQALDPGTPDTDDALDLVRMDDDGWQMTRPPDQQLIDGHADAR